MECKKHGKLNDDLYYIQKIDEKWNTLRCKLCNREAARKSAQKRKKEIMEWNRKDRKNNPERYRKYARDYRARHGKRRNAAQIARK